MNEINKGGIINTKLKQQPASNMVTLYHDTEQNIASKASQQKCRQITKEFLRLEEKYDIPVTYNVVGRLFEEQPDLIEWIINKGQEVAFHSYNHQSDWNAKYYSDEVDLCRKVSLMPKGYRSPRSQWNQTTLKSLWKNGFLWSAEVDYHKEPYFIYQGLVRLPIAADDWHLHTESMDVDEWVKHFSELFKSRYYFAFGSHDFITSFAPKERLKAWEKVLQIATENKALLVTFSEAADLFRRAALSRYYSTNVKNWNQSTRVPYQTKRFQEILRTEAEKLNRPVIADLGSGCSELSSSLKDLAKKNYCVNNTQSMVKDIDSNGCIQTCVGEVTDSDLPDNSADLIICTHIIEYLFWPNRLADEIKRIGKIGATYFVAFPAFRNQPRTKNGSFPDRIRHYFTPDEIQEWTKQIGPGRLIGIQYKKSEPDSPETEQIYKEVEKKPPLDVCPTNWIFIGTVKEKYIAKQYRKTIPVSDCNLHLFEQQRCDLLRCYVTKIRQYLLKPKQRSGI